MKEVEFKTTEFVFTWDDGSEDVHYRRPYGSEECEKMMETIDDMPKGTPYSYRHI